MHRLTQFIANERHTAQIIAIMGGVHLTFVYIVNMFTLCSRLHKGTCLQSLLCNENTLTKSLQKCTFTIKVYKKVL